MSAASARPTANSDTGRQVPEWREHELLLIASIHSVEDDGVDMRIQLQVRARPLKRHHRAALTAAPTRHPRPLPPEGVYTYAVLAGNDRITGIINPPQIN
jgi:hypothetical protein